MSLYILLSGKHGRFESEGGEEPNLVIYRAGEQIELTAEEAEALGARVEAVAAPAAPSPKKAEPAPDPAPAAATRKRKGRR